MTSKSLKQRLIEKFGEAVESALSDSDRPRRLRFPERQRLLLEHHSRWLRSAGRYGRRYSWSAVDVTFLQRDLDGSVFKQAILRDLNIDWSNFRQADFRKAELDNVVFYRCDLEGADFRGARFREVRFIDCLDIALARFDRHAKGISIEEEGFNIQCSVSHVPHTDDPTP